MNDITSDLITRIRNAQRVKHKTVDAPLSNMSERILKVLQSEGYINGYSIVKNDEIKHPYINIELKYYENKPVICEIKRISKPGRRVYSSIKKLPLMRNGLGIYVLSTNKGVMSDTEARKQSLGGEVLFSVF